MTGVLHTVVNVASIHNVISTGACTAVQICNKSGSIAAGQPHVTKHLNQTSPVSDSSMPPTDPLSDAALPAKDNYMYENSTVLLLPGVRLGSTRDIVTGPRVKK